MKIKILQEVKLCKICKLDTGEDLSWTVTSPYSGRLKLTYLLLELIDDSKSDDAPHKMRGWNFKTYDHATEN